MQGLKCQTILKYHNMKIIWYLLVSPNNSGITNRTFKHFEEILLSLNF